MRFRDFFSRITDRQKYNGFTAESSRAAAKQRQKKLSPSKRSEIARKAARSRWGNRRRKPAPKAAEPVAIRPVLQQDQLEPLTVSVHEAKRLSGLGTSTIYELMKNGTLVRIKVGHRTLIKYATLKALLKID